MSGGGVNQAQVEGITVIKDSRPEAEQTGGVDGRQRLKTWFFFFLVLLIRGGLRKKVNKSSKKPHSFVFFPHGLKKSMW